MALRYIQAQKFKLAGSGITSTDTTIVLTNMTLPDGTTKIVTADLGEICYATLEPGTSKEEMISFTSITQNVGGTATLGGVTRGLRFVNPHDEVSANKFSHAGGTIMIISNTSGLYQKIVDYINGVAIAGAADASTTVKGIVEEATEAEIIAGTATGSTGARLFTNPSTLVTALTSIVPSTTIDVYNANATWTKPTGAKVVEVICIGGGGGGGGGLSAAVSNSRYGAGGGGGGAITSKIFRASDLAATVAVTVPAAASGGAATGANGGAGGTVSFGTHLYSYGGGGGSGGGNTTGGGSGGGSGGAGVTNSGSAVLGGVPATAIANGISGQGAGGLMGNTGNGLNAEFGGGGGGGTNGGSTPRLGGSSIFASGGGGGGGSIDSGNPGSYGTATGAAGGATNSYTAGGGGAGGTSGTSAGTTGTSRSGFGCGDGGGGGGANNAGAGFAGGAGGTPGGGGGGGGGGTGSNVGGVGGAGGAGEVRVITYF